MADLHTAGGTAVELGLVAVSPAGERLIIECERPAMRRTVGERDAQ